jgi:NadR type nicotinamide-nucleotide adenylyltransferase
MSEPEKKILKRIVIIGPESTGKSTLARQLAEHYQSLWVPEFARTYLAAHGMDYNYDDLLTIAKGQVELEAEIETSITSSSVTNKDMLFIDTDMYVMQVWCEFVFQKCHSWILEQIVSRPYDLYLLCDIDLPWVKDDLREYPDVESRRKLYSLYKELMISQHVPWVEVNGAYDARLRQAIDAVNTYIRL